MTKGCIRRHCERGTAERGNLCLPYGLFRCARDDNNGKLLLLAFVIAPLVQKAQAGWECFSFYGTSGLSARRLVW